MPPDREKCSIQKSVARNDTFVLALTLRCPMTDIALVGCRGVDELEESLAALELRVDDALVQEVGAILAEVEPLRGNRLGQA